MSWRFLKYESMAEGEVILCILLVFVMNLWYMGDMSNGYKINGYFMKYFMFYQTSNITNHFLIFLFDVILIISLVSSAILDPLVIGQSTQINFLSQLLYFLNLISKFLIIKANMPNNLITIQTEHKLRLSFNIVMFSNFRCSIWINFNNFYPRMVRSKLWYMLIWFFALRIPIGTEIDDMLSWFIFI